MASQREARRIREEEEEKRKRSGPNWGNIILGAASAYLTAGLAPMALGAAASLAPTASNVLMAIKGGVDATSAQTPEAAAMGGIAAGATPTVNKWAQNEAFNATKEAQEKTVAAAEAARREWEKLPENVKYLAKGVSFDDTGKRSYTYENPDTKAKIAKIAAQTAAEKAAAADVLNQNRVSAMKNTGTFKYTETPESTRFNTTLPESNPSFPNDPGNPRFYTPNPPKVSAPSTTFKPSAELFAIVNEYNGKGTMPTEEDKAAMKKRYSPQEFYWLISKIKKPTKSGANTPGATSYNYGEIGE